MRANSQSLWLCSLRTLGGYAFVPTQNVSLHQVQPALVRQTQWAYLELKIEVATQLYWFRHAMLANLATALPGGTQLTVSPGLN